MEIINGAPASNTKPLERFLGRIEQKIQDRSSAPVLIVALGDSVTQGASALNQLLHEDVYHAVLKRLLQQKYPNCVFSVINAGVGGESAANGLQRLERDVIRHGPDLVLIGFALNDATSGGLAGLSDFACTIHTLVNDIRNNTEADIILLTPNMMVEHENSLVPETYNHLAEPFIHIQKSGTLAAYAAKLCEIGEKLNIPVANIYLMWEEMATRGVDVTAMLANGLNHPDAQGHRMAAEVIMQVIKKCIENQSLHKS